MKTPTNIPGPSPFPRVSEPVAATGQGESDEARRFEEHDVIAEVEEMFRALLEDAPRRPEAHPYRPMPSALPMQLVLGSERLRALVGDNATVTVIVAVPDRRQFEDIEFPGQIETGCIRHGFRIKAFVEGPLQVLTMHVERRETPLPGV
jgi:hypothetical protein